MTSHGRELQANTGYTEKPILQPKPNNNNKTKQNPQKQTNNPEEIIKIFYTCLARLWRKKRSSTQFLIGNKDVFYQQNIVPRKQRLQLKVAIKD